MPAVRPSTLDTIQAFITQQIQNQALLPDELNVALVSLEKQIKALESRATLIQTQDGNDGYNWVGILQEYYAAHPHLSSRGLIYKDVSVPIPGVCSPGHQCKVSIAERDGHREFPGADGGLVGGVVPWFSRKKDAKQYAAKCAAEWLRAQGVLRNAQSPLAQAQLQQSQKQQQQQTVSGHNFNANGNSSGNGKTADADAESAVKRVCVLCNSLGFVQPVYDIKPVAAAGGDLFRGSVHFGAHGAAMTIDVAGIRPVEDVLGRKEAREQLAENLLEVLECERARRDKEQRLFFGSSSSPLTSPSPSSFAPPIATAATNHAVVETANTDNTTTANNDNK